MKPSTFFSVAALATSALASPISGLNGLTGTVSTVLEGVVGKIGKVNKVESSGDIVTLLEGAVKNVKEHTGAMNATLSKVQDGKMSKDAADNELLDQVQGIQLDLSKIVNSLTTGAGIPVSEGDVDRVLAIANVLVDELLATVKSLVTILGLRPQLTLLLHSVFSLVSNILTLLTGLLAGLLPGLVAGLSPLLAALGNGLLAPILTPVVALVAALAGP